MPLSAQGRSRIVVVEFVEHNNWEHWPARTIHAGRLNYGK